MHFFDSCDIDLDTFLARVWQKQPYVFRQVMTEYIDNLHGDDLAGLACEPGVESRIIKGKEEKGEWRCQQGPMDESSFSTLAEKDWTLLVQGLDQYSDEIAALLAQFRFLPQWRLEDVMASYAPIGGGVGPHFDYYDVFLIQVSGQREWKIGQQCDESTPLQDNDQVKLLDTFTMSEAHLLNPGDMIYIPAGMAHWGTATSNDCITFSIGFRAPSEKELMVCTMGNLAEQFSLHRRYKDTLPSIDAHPAKINDSVHQQLADMLHALSVDDIKSMLGQSFGELVTEPRYIGHGEHIEYSIDDIQQPLSNEGWIEISLSSHTRLAFSDNQLFVNGVSYPMPEVLSRQIYEGRLSQDFLKEEALLVIMELLDRQDIILV